MVSAAAIVALSGCAAPAERAPSGGGRPALRDLERLSETLVVRPREGTTPGAAIDAESARKQSLSLDDALREVLAGSGPELPTPPGVRAERAEEDRWRALRLYTRAGEHAAAGKLAEAVTDLESAARLDPGSPEIWVRLGEAQLDASKRVAGLSSLRRAAALGADTPRIWLLLGTDAQAGGRHAEAAWLLARARAKLRAGDDPALPYVVDARLGDALTVLGYGKAGFDAQAAALDLPDSWPSQTIYREELMALYRSRGDRWSRLADEAAGRGDQAAAALALSRAAELPTSDASGILTRLVTSASLGGRAGEASLIILRDIEAHGSVANRRHTALIREHVRGTPAAEPFARAVRELASAGSPESGGSLAIAEWAALGGAAGRSALLRRLDADPDDRECVRVLFDDLSGGGASGVLGVATDLIRVRPEMAAAIGESIVESGRGVGETLERLSRRRDDAGTLLRGEMLLALRSPADGLEIVRARRWGPSFARAGHELWARLAAAGGAWEDFDRALSLLPSLSGSDALPRARALSAAQRPAEAYAAVETFGLEAAEPIVLGRLAQRAGRAADAERWYRAALAANALDDRAYEGLLGLFASGRTPEDAQRIGELARELRRASPTGSLLRWLRAQELLERGQAADAADALFELAEEEPTAAQLLTLLAQATARVNNAARTARVESWLAELLSERPESVTIRAALARTLASAGRLDDAISLLDATPISIPRHLALRERERLLAEAGRTAEAIAVRRERLALAPAGIPDAVERTAAALPDDPGSALASLRAGVPASATLNEEQLTVLSAACEAALERPGEPESLAGLIALALERGAVLSPRGHDRHVDLLARRSSTTADEFLAAARAVLRQFPSLGDAVYRRIAQSLLQSGRGNVAAAVMIGAVAGSTPPSQDLLAEAFRLTALEGGPGEVDQLIDIVPSVDQIRMIFSRFQLEQDLPDDPTLARAELAYMLGQLLGDRGRDDVAAEAYRRAVELNPAHGWANNNLGYHLVETGGDLEEAVRLLRASLETLPGNGSVLDSLGWAQYRRGRFADDAEGEGAVTLLLRAVETERGVNNPVILDHAGDALWRVDRKAEAITMWTRADAALSRLGLERVGEGEASALALRLRALSGEVAAKLRAANAGGEPQIAPTAAERATRTP